jgi:hypothetical protein
MLVMLKNLFTFVFDVWPVHSTFLEENLYILCLIFIFYVPRILLEKKFTHV